MKGNGASKEASRARQVELGDQASGDIAGKKALGWGMLGPSVHHFIEDGRTLLWWRNSPAFPMEKSYGSKVLGLLLNPPLSGG